MNEAKTTYLDYNTSRHRDGKVYQLAFVEVINGEVENMIYIDEDQLPSSKELVQDLLNRSGWQRKILS